MEKDITKLLERLEAFEERLGVTLEGLFASIDQNKYITVNGEIHPREGTQLTQNVQLVVSAYDSSGRVLNTASNYFRADSFFGFETFSITLVPSPVAVSKVRIYPKPQ